MELQTKLAQTGAGWGRAIWRRSGLLIAARNQTEEIVRNELLSPPETEHEDETVNPELQQYLETRQAGSVLRQIACRNANAVCNDDGAVRFTA